MRLTHFKILLEQLNELDFILPNGHKVPSHFHITEIGQVNKKYMDCGGELREENTINFQLWENTDTHHRLKPQKLLNIIELAERKRNSGVLHGRVYGVDHGAVHHNLKENCRKQRKPNQKREKIIGNPIYPYISLYIPIYPYIYS